MELTFTFWKLNTNVKTNSRKKAFLIPLIIALISIGIITDTIGQTSTAGQLIQPAPSSNTFKSVEIETVFILWDTCIKFGWGVHFKVNGGSGPTGGHIIQKIKRRINVFECTNGNNYPGYPDIYEFWEAFEVKPNTDTTIVVNENLTGKPHNDVYKIFTPDDTYGDGKVEGTIAFIANNPDGSSALDSTWINNPYGPAGDIPYTFTKPTWWNDMVASKKCRKHNLDLTWNCCHNGGDTMTYDTTTSYFNYKDIVNIEQVRMMHKSNDNDIVPFGNNKNWNENSGSAILNRSLENAMNDNSKIINMYPNPTSDQVTITTNIIKDNLNIYIYNTTGQLIKTIVTDKKEIQINLEGYSNGLYFFTIQSIKNDIVKDFKIVKK